MNKGTVIVISGPSGVGKGTVVEQILLDKEKFVLSISATTRSPRENEKHGVNYFYLTKEEFQSRIDNGMMLEYAPYCDNFYGTPRAYVEENVSKGKNVILEIEVKGALTVKENMPEVVSIFIMPPSMQVLEKRLRGRGTEPEDVIQKRLEKAVEEMKQSPKYDYIVVNNTVEQCVNDIKNIINLEKMKSPNMIDFVKGVLEDADEKTISR